MCRRTDAERISDHITDRQIAVLRSIDDVAIAMAKLAVLFRLDIDAAFRLARSVNDRRMKLAKTRGDA